VRYFRDGQAEEYSIKMKPDGSPLAFQHKLAEDAPGASLSKEDALAKAEQYLREEKKVDLSQWKLVEANSDKRIHRTDHELAWQRNAPFDETHGSVASAEGHAYERMKVAVLGDEVVDYRGAYYSKPEARDELELKEGETSWKYIKIPDEWRRRQEEATLFRTIYGFGLPILLYGGLGVTAVVVFFMNLRSEAMRAIPWKKLALWAVWGLVAYVLIIAFGNRLQYFLNSYSTAIPFKTMMGGLTIGLLVGAVLYPGGLAVLFGVAAYYGNRAFGENRVPVGGGLPGVYYRDALWFGICGTTGYLGVRRLVEAAAQHWPTIHRDAPLSVGQYFDAVLPCAFVFGGALVGGLLIAGLIALLAAFVGAVVQARWLRVLLFLLGALYLTGNGWGDGRDFAKQFLAEAIVLAVIVIAVMRIVRFNVLGYFLVVACLSLLGAATQLLTQPDPFYRTNGYSLLLMIGLLLAWTLFMWKTRPSEGDSGQLATPQEVSAAGNL
jgi:hypothetical protein